MFNCQTNDQQQLKCWGLNFSGELGYGDGNTRGDQPNEMGPNLPFVNVGNGLKIVEYSLGMEHICVRLDNNQIKCWGRNSQGQLGLGMNKPVIGDSAEETPDKLEFVNLGDNLVPTKLATGSSHTCVLFSNKRVKCFGNNVVGQSGLERDKKGAGKNPNDMGNQLPFLKFGKGVRIQSIHTFAAALHNCVIIAKKQSMKCWGLNNQYQLGYGDQVNRGLEANTMGDSLPTVKLGSEDRVSQVAVGREFTCALRIDDQLRCFGANNFGSLGIGSTERVISKMDNALVATPYDLAGKKIKQLAAGDDILCVLFDDSLTVKCIGDGTKGKLGQGDAEVKGGSPTTTLDKIPAINLGTNNLQILSISLRATVTCVMFVDFQLKCFGSKEFGILGTGSATGVIGTNANDMGENLPFIDLSSTFRPTSSPIIVPTTSPTPPTPPTFLPTRSPTSSPTESRVPNCGYRNMDKCLKDKECDWEDGKCIPFSCRTFTEPATCMDIRCYWVGWIEGCLEVQCGFMYANWICNQYPACKWDGKQCLTK